MKPQEVVPFLPNGGGDDEERGGASINSIVTVEDHRHAPMMTTTTTAINGTEMAPTPCTSSSSSSSSNNSSFMGAVFNFTNCIVGAGAIGLGGAIAQSGGAISIVAILCFAVLTKWSLDLVIDLSLQCGRTSYEELGHVAFGRMGRNAVLLSKFLYSLGCLVAYLIVVKDNFASGLQHLIYGKHDHAQDHAHHDPLYHFLSDASTLTMLLSVTVLLPLCLLRDMSPLSNLSMLSVFCMAVIVVIILVLFLAIPSIRMEGDGFYVNWFQVRPGVFQSLGTFVFTFVSQHTVHLTFQSLRPDLRTLHTWKRVSFYSLGIATHISLAVGLAVYMTFWQASRSDLFQMYPMMKVIDVAKLLLCMTMLWTFPLPFFTCREVLIVVALCPPTTTTTTTTTMDEEQHPDQQQQQQLHGNDHALQLMTSDHDPASLREPLLSEHENDTFTTALDENDANHTAASITTSRFLIPGKERQLVLVYHVLLTVLLWALTTVFAILAPSLGDVLNLVGCATGTLIAFLLPALFSFQLRGYTHLAMLILVVGGAVGLIGTWFSVRKIVWGK